ncbi:MAG: 4-(cytidine 5'-diphospho)-2-C-methyl-D-erythritol kinase [Candidatus Sericytochromatia bacterium]|nr:4-(cytidine 5'-diphospho)-2-C-methyl-D-erythritol kinase [Candidatus Tanganyikabacteria bacterium]
MLSMARAKINLFLSVGARRPDGFHDVDTIMCAVDRADILDISLASRPRLEIQLEDLPPGQDLGAGPDNLIWRAAEALVGPDRGWRITLYKTIPHGAGFGGGSSDAALTLTALAALYRLDADLPRLARDLGSDVGFFLIDGGTARCRGRGEVVTPLSALPVLHTVLAVPPDARVATADAYRWLDESPDRPRGDVDDFLAALATGEPRAIAAAMWNDFDPVVTRMLPLVGTLRDRLLTRGALGVQVCGSGAGIVAIFQTPDEANAAAFALRGEGVWAVYAPTAPRTYELGRDPMAAAEGGLIG